jgi:hypothetical protein
LARILAFFDESGDLGWKFDAPYRQGGSSRFFVIASALGPGKLHHPLGRVIKKLWHTQGWTSQQEKKWKDIPNKARLSFAELALGCIEANPDIRLSVSILDKQALQPHLRPDHHLLYAHLATQLIASDLAACSEAEVCPDELNQGTGAANLLQHLMRHEVWFRRGCAPSIKQIPKQKHLEQALGFCDMLAGAAASQYEDGRSEPWRLLEQAVTVRHGC